MNWMKQEVVWNGNLWYLSDFWLWADAWISISEEQEKTLKEKGATETLKKEADQESPKIWEEKETTERSDKWLNLENFWIPTNGLPDAQNTQSSSKIIEAIEPSKKGLWESFTNLRKRN